MKQLYDYRNEDLEVDVFDFNGVLYVSRLSANCVDEFELIDLTYFTDEPELKRFVNVNFDALAIKNIKKLHTNISGFILDKFITDLPNL